MTYCCEVFPKIAKRFRWYEYFDSASLTCPYLYDKEFNEVEVNFCPSCGADIRGIVISKEEFDKLK